ncbi:MAG: sigma 54-interacting transcriptional regulator [Desulfamplus sp.]|nr:sigma 54-interacting transcriptional regulator [Desulfamplus sp.]
MIDKSCKNSIKFDDIDIAALFCNLHEGVLIADTEGTIVYYNKTQSQIDNISIDDAIGKKITELYKLSQDESTTMCCIKSGQPVRDHVIIYQSRSGKVANAISNVFPLFRGGKIIGAISFTKDYQMLQNIASIEFKEAELNLTKEGKFKDQKSKTSRKSLNNGTRFTFKDLIGKNVKLIHAINMAKLSADSPSPIMISGETGTGKELFAQSIHNFRSTSKERFIPINCSAIPENLLEGILFGTSKGAFTGSIDKAGLFEQANGGTIFLDELDSMPLSLQSKVLRVVQEKKVRRVGALEETKLNIKIISTVSKDPDTIIKSGSLRLDLFYRMGVVFILIPPLRERMDDMELLISHFIDKFNKELSEHVVGISDQVREIFYGYQWHGNVRELEHVIEGAMNIVDKDKSIKLKHIPNHVLGLLKSSQKSQPQPFEPHHDNYPPLQELKDRYLIKNKKITLSELLSENEKESICNALKSTKGNAAQASKMLGLSPQSFHYKIKKYKIDKANFV